MKIDSIKTDHFIGELNSIMTSWTSFIGSWVAWFPEAAMTATALAEIFHWNVILAVIVAVAVEFMGHEVNTYYQDAQAFNEEEELWQKKHKAKNLRYKLESMDLALALLVGYYLSTWIFVIGTAVYGAITTQRPVLYLMIPFPIATAIGNIVANLRASLHRKRRRRDDAATERQSARQSHGTRTEPARTDEKSRISARDWRKLARSPNGSAAMFERFRTEPRSKHATIVNDIMRELGYEEVPQSTARDRAAVARKELGI